MSYRPRKTETALTLATIAASVILSTAALAQSAGGLGTGDAGVADVIVTGSRIARPANLVAPTPVTQLSSQDIAQVGLQSTAEILAELPQTSNSQTAENNNRYVNGAGLQAINLRGLGAYRTLTLVDGRRHIGSLSGVNNSGGTSEVDTAVIAPLLIDRIDVVTGGSSAAYGADAVAGVVNFILKKNYQGAEVTVEEGQATAGGKSTTSVDAIFGSNFADDRGNITVALDFQNQAGIKTSDRDYAQSQTQWYPNPNDTGPTFVTYDGIRSSVYSNDFAPTISTTLPGHPAYSQRFNTDGSGLRPFNRGTLVPTNPTTSYGNTGDGYATQEFNNLQAPNNRKIVDALINYKIAEDVGPINDINFFADIKYADSRGGPFTNGVQSTPTSIFTQIAVPVSNPYIPADLRSQLAGYTGSTIVSRNTDGSLSPLVPGTIYNLYQGAQSYSPTGQGYAGPTFNIRKITADWSLRTSQYEYQYNRDVVGFEGHIFDKFKYEVFYNYGQNNTQFINNDRITQNLINAIDTTTTASGAITCRSSVTYPQNGCVPINPFKVGPLTSAQYNYLYTNTHENDELTENNFVADITTPDLFSYPTPISGTVASVGFAGGFEYREESTDSRPDPLQKLPTGQIAGNNAGTRDTVGSYKTRELFFETNVPVLRDLPFVKAIDFDGAIRYQSVTTTGDDFTWNARATWDVSDDFKIRGGFAKSVRVPNGDELYSSGGQSFIAIFDPCGGANGANRAGNAERAITCANVPTYVVSPFASSSNITGNTSLLAETSQNAQIGGVFTPSFIPGLTASADYFSILIKNAITTTDANTVTRLCYDSNQPLYCSFISRNGDGSLNVVQTPYVNGGKENLKGVDFTLGYLFPLADHGIHFLGDEAALSFNGDASWYINHTLLLDPTDPGSAQHLAGSLGFPRVKALAKFTFDDGPFLISATTRYYSSQTLNVIGAGADTYDNNTVGDLVYQDFYARYNWRKMTFFVGVNNAFDVRPPHIPTVYSGGNFPATNSNAPQNGQALSVVDNTGRYVFGGLTLKF